MNTETLKQDIKDKELRLSQLRTMDTNRLSAEDRELIKSLEAEIKLLQQKMNLE